MSVQHSTDPYFNECNAQTSAHALMWHKVICRNSGACASENVISRRSQLPTYLLTVRTKLPILNLSENSGKGMTSLPNLYTELERDL